MINFLKRVYRKIKKGAEMMRPEDFNTFMF